MQWYIFPALPHSQDSRMKRCQRFVSAERGERTLLLPWLMEYARRTPTRQSGQSREETDADMFKKASSTCRHPGGVTVAARSLLVGPRAPGNRKRERANESKVPGGGSDIRLRSSSGSSGRKFLRPGGREWSQLAPGGRSRPTGGPRGHQFSQRVIRRGKRRPALFTPAVDTQDYLRARKPWSWHWSLLRDKKLSTIQTPSRRNSFSSFCNQTSLPWVKNAAPSAWG